jgi:chorismate mutase
MIMDFNNIIIAGPCSAESREQLIDTAKALAATGKVSVLRAGIWKPRTRPDGFEGVGEKGLAWMAEAKAITSLPIAVEVAQPKHVEACLKYGMDAVWIGARTSVSPFALQEIADVLRGVDVAVMVKNPVIPDIELWRGAVERIVKCVKGSVAAIHRGFSTYDKSVLRNDPIWDIPIEFMRTMPDVPVICDPSHIAGKRSLIAGIAQQALDLGMSGLMIESHINPSEALTDARQQLKPDDLAELLNSLVFRTNLPATDEQDNILNSMRRQIDLIDQQVLHALSQRLKIVEEIGFYKNKHKITILQIKRWNEILRSRIQLADELGLDRGFMQKMLQLVHRESIRIQSEITKHEK